MNNKTTTQKGKELYSYLLKHGKTDYGAIIPALEIQQIIGIEYPETGTRKQFNEIALIELAVIDYVRNILLGEGKALSQSNGDYRILLPSENNRYIEKYMSSADKKLKRALKLSKNTPKNELYESDHSIKIHLKRQNIEKELNRNKQLQHSYN